MAVSLGPQNTAQRGIGVAANDEPVEQRTAARTAARSRLPGDWHLESEANGLRKSRWNLERLKWLTVIAPPLLIGVFEFLRHEWPLARFLPTWAGNLLEVGLVMVGTVIFSRVVFGIIEGITQQNERRRQEAEALFDVGTKITALLDRERVLQSVVEQARRLLATDVATIGLVESEDMATIRLVATSGMTIEQLKAMREQMNHEMPVEEAIHTGKPSFEELPAQPGDGVRCRLAVPLLLGRRVIGSLCVGSREIRRFSHDEVNLLARLANQAAIAIENARLQAQAQQVATLEERDRIVRELHDGLGQTLNYLALKTDVIEDHLHTGRVEQAQTELARIRKATRDAAADVRESILGLRTSLAAGEDWLAALRRYLIQYGELNGIAAELIADEGTRIVLPLNSETQLLRIVQEALANVRKHATADKVWVRVHSTGERLQVVVEDNGRGFDPGETRRQRGAHFGLMIMRERAHLLGGDLKVESQPGQGARVAIELPLARKGGA